jgi:hypothetical protein
MDSVKDQNSKPPEMVNSKKNGDPIEVAFLESVKDLVHMLTDERLVQSKSSSLPFPTKTFCDTICQIIRLKKEYGGIPLNYCTCLYSIQELTRYLSTIYVATDINRISLNINTLLDSLINHYKNV